jgi:post-segregation antitoxin (ccd killing protein)
VLGLVGTEDFMANLTIRMDKPEKDRLMAWAAAKGISTTQYIKQLIAADMASGSPQERADAWLRENEAAIHAEAEHVKNKGIPGSHLALNHPWPDAKI